MTAIDDLASELNTFWDEAGITYDQYCRGTGILNPRVPDVAEWEERLESFPNTSTFIRASYHYCETGLPDELKVLLEAIAIDNGSNVFIRALWGLNCRHDELLVELMRDASKNVRIQTVWLLRDIEDVWALEQLRAMRSIETDDVVITQLDGIIAFREDPKD